MNNKRLLIFSALCILLGSFLLAAHYYNKQQKEEIRQNLSSHQEALHRKTAASIGAEQAQVVLVEFLDPECESCRAFFPHVKDLLKQYPDTLRLEVRYAPFHPNAAFAISLIEAARLQGKYWQALERVLLTQPQWGSHHNPRPELLWSILAELELDMEKLKKDSQKAFIKDYIAQDIRDGKKLQVNKTPSFFINAKPLEPFGLKPLKEMVRRAHAGGN